MYGYVWVGRVIYHCIWLCRVMYGYVSFILVVYTYSIHKDWAVLALTTSYAVFESQVQAWMVEPPTRCGSSCKIQDVTTGTIPSSKKARQQWPLNWYWRSLFLLFGLWLWILSILHGVPFETSHLYTPFLTEFRSWQAKTGGRHRWLVPMCTHPVFQRSEYQISNYLSRKRTN